MRLSLNFVNIHDPPGSRPGAIRAHSQNVGDRPGGQRNGSKRAGGGGTLRSSAGSCGALGAGAASGARWKGRGVPGKAGRSFGSTEKSRGVRSPSRPRSCRWPGAAQAIAAIATTKAVCTRQQRIALADIAKVFRFAALPASIRAEREAWRKPHGQDEELPLVGTTRVHYRALLDLLLLRG